MTEQYTGFNQFTCKQTAPIRYDSHSKAQRENVLRLHRQGFTSLECAKRTYGGALPEEIFDTTAPTLSFEGSPLPITRLRALFTGYCRQVEEWIKEEGAS